jgi:hypothetical protein
VTGADGLAEGTEGGEVVHGFAVCFLDDGYYHFDYKSGDGCEMIRMIRMRI